MTQTIRGGGHVGPNPWFGYRATWPLASLSVSRESIVLSVWPLRYRLDRASIRCLVKKRILGWSSLVIVHTNPAYPKSVVFQPLRFSVVDLLLGAHGYQLSIEEPPATSIQPPTSISYSNTIGVFGLIAAILGVIAAIVAAVVVAR
jgi:hypothetical protein